MKKASLIKEGVILSILTLLIVLLIIFFIKLNYSKSGESGGLPSINLWKPIGVDIGLNLSENDSAIEKTKQIETPSDTEIVKIAAQRYWLSFITLFLIVVLLIAWVMIIFKVYNG